MFMTFNELTEWQKLPLEEKEIIALEIMAEASETSKHNMAIAFSGGKDSMVLWHLYRRIVAPQVKEPFIIYGNTGVEYPESLKFAREIGKAWGGEHFIEVRPARTEAEGLKYAAQREVLAWLIDTGKISEVLKKDGKLRSTDALEKAATPEMWADFRRRGLVWPAGTLMSYWWCCDQYGFPILGKAASKLEARRINIDCFLRFSKSATTRKEIQSYYDDILRHVKISQHCCTVLKKEPSRRICDEREIDVVLMGIMASESHRRKTLFCDNGYLYPVKGDYKQPFQHWHCHPLAIWTDDDIWAYIKKHGVPYSPLYDMGYTDKDGVEHKIKRNGCMGCATDAAFPNNHMSTLRRTHPAQWRGIMRYGMAEQMRNLRIARANGQISILDVLEADDLIDRRPCAFDSIDRVIWHDDTMPEYDAEVDDQGARA